MSVYGSDRIKKLSNYKGKLYFISEKDIDNTTLKPRIPDNYFTKNGYENSSIKRVCFAPSINKCLTALSQNCSNKEYFVYEPMGEFEVYKPSTKDVPDCKITGEMWIVEPVKIKKIGKILCTGDDGKDGMKFKYGNNNESELYDWNYKWIEKE